MVAVFINFIEVKQIYLSHGSDEGCEVRRARCEVVSVALRTLLTYFIFMQILPKGGVFAREVASSE